MAISTFSCSIRDGKWKMSISFRSAQLTLSLRTMPKDVRAAGIDQTARQRESPTRPPLAVTRRSGSSLKDGSHESIPFVRPYTNGASEVVSLPVDAATMRGDGPSAGLRDDEVMDADGWVKKRVEKVFKRKDRDKDKDRDKTARPWEGSLSKALGYFRVNLGTLG